MEYNDSFNITINEIKTQQDNESISALEERYDQLAKESKEKEDDFLIVIGEINAIMAENCQRIKILSHENNSLFISMINIKKERDNKKKLNKIYMLKQERNLKKEKMLQRELRSLENQITISKKNEEIYKRDKDQLEKIINSSLNSNILDNLNTLLNSKRELIEKYQAEIDSLRKEYKTHKNCENKEKNLLSQLSSLRSELEYLKKQNENKEQKVIYSRIKKKYNRNALSRSFLDKSSSQKSMIVPKSKYKEYQDKVNKMNHNLSCNNLFEDEEKKFLEIIIPKERIKVYEKKYENINSQKEEIEKIYKSMNDKQRQKIQKKKEHCEYQEMKIKESNCVNIQLNKELSDLNAKINKIKKKLKNTFKENETLGQLLNMKTKENEKLKDMITNFKPSPIKVIKHEDMNKRIRIEKLQLNLNYNKPKLKLNVYNSGTRTTNKTTQSRKQTVLINQKTKQYKNANV